MRLGLYPKEIVNKLKSRKNIWIHAVSVGEAIAIKKLITELRKKFPNMNLVISTVTATGNRVAKSISDKGDAVIYLPLDFGFAVKRAINIINPSFFIIIETELWPRLIKNLHDKKSQL